MSRLTTTINDSLTKEYNGGLLFTEIRQVLHFAKRSSHAAELDPQCKRIIWLTQPFDWTRDDGLTLQFKVKQTILAPHKLSRNRSCRPSSKHGGGANCLHGPTLSRARAEV